MRKFAVDTSRHFRNVLLGRRSTSATKAAITRSSLPTSSALAIGMR